jgi:hypothetical protein
MAKATSISLSKLTSSVHAAVKAAAAQHPKFNKVEPPQGLTVSYLIRGFPLPDFLAATVTLGEAQAFADTVAGQVAGDNPVAFERTAAAASTTTRGAVLSVGGHIICGFPPAVETIQVEA